MTDGSGNKWRVIESEMNRFEAEISSLARQPNFIPAQLRRPGIPHGHGFISSPPVMARPMLRPPGSMLSRPAGPTIISGAPKVYSSEPTTTASATKVVPPVSTFQQQPSRPTLQHPPLIRSLVPKQALFTPPQPQQQQPQPPTHLGIGPSANMAMNLPVVNPHLASQAVADIHLPQGGIPDIMNPITTTTISTTISSTLDANKPSTSGSSGAGDNNSTANEKKKKGKKNAKDDGKPKKILRSAGGQVWEDLSLHDWDTSDFRLFCGDLGNDVTDEVLTRVFGRYPSFQKAKVIRDKRTNKTKGYGFVSFKDPNDFVRAIRELDGRYVGSRPIKLRKSNWKNRNLDQAKKRDRERNSLIGIKKPAKR